MSWLGHGFRAASASRVRGPTPSATAVRQVGRGSRRPVAAGAGRRRAGPPRRLWCASEPGPRAEGAQAGGAERGQQHGAGAFGVRDEDRLSCPAGSAVSRSAASRSAVLQIPPGAGGRRDRPAAPRPAVVPPSPSAIAAGSPAPGLAGRTTRAPTAPAVRPAFGIGGDHHRGDQPGWPARRPGSRARSRWPPGRGAEPATWRSARLSAAAPRSSRHVPSTRHGRRAEWTARCTAGIR